MADRGSGAGLVCVSRPFGGLAGWKMEVSQLGMAVSLVAKAADMEWVTRALTLKATPIALPWKKSHAALIIRINFSSVA